MLIDNLSPSLTSLDVSFSYTLQNDELLETIVNRCPSLKHLVLGGVTHNRGKKTAEFSNEVLLKISQLTNLQTLQMFGVSNVQAQTLKSFIPFLTDLRNLNLGCIASVDDSVLTTIASSCTRIRKLRLESSPATITLEGLIESMKHLPDLEYMRLFGAHGLKSNGSNRPLPEFKCLKMQTLDIYTCKGLDCAGVGALLSRYPNLSTLVMTSIQNVGAQAYYAIPRHCKKLKVLRIQYPESTKWIDEEYFALLTKTYGETLEELNIHMSRSVPDNALLGLCSFEKLKILELGDTPSLPTLRTILTKFPKLRLSLSDFLYTKEEGEALEAEFPASSLQYYCS